MAPGSFLHCAGNPALDPEKLIHDNKRLAKARELLAKDDLQGASVVLLGIPEKDTYTYHAMTSISLQQAHAVVQLGGINELHTWYRDANETPRDPPPRADADAYASIFSPSTLTSSALKNFATNAKKGSIRSEVAARLTEKRFLHPGRPELAVPKCKKPPCENPYVDFWSWSCRSLEWCGPCESSDRRHTSHHVLPIFMHHFGCVVPSHEALEILRLVADGRAVADVGSGNGYWTFMLRQYGLTVHPVDNMQSEWRVNWVADTVVSDGVRWLRKKDSGRDMVLLLVYPVVGAGLPGGGGGKEGGFTRNLVEAYRGDTLAVVATQNSNGYTAFGSMTMVQFMEREHPEWTKVVQIPVPSFACKDEALYIFQRGDRAPK